MFLTRFQNEPICDYAIEANAKRAEAAVARLERGLGAYCPAVIGGRKVETEKTIVVRLELSGVARDEVQVTVDGDVLRIRGIRRLAAERTPTNLIKRAAMQAGMRTLRQDGWRKVCRGQTTVEEVLRVTKVD